MQPVIKNENNSKGDKMGKKDKVKHEKNWKSTKSYHHGKTKIVHGRYLSKNMM